MEDIFKETVYEEYHITEDGEKLNDILYNKKFENNKINHSIKVKDLIIDIDNHKEFNPKYIDILDYLDLSKVDTTNLKLDGLNLSNTVLSERNILGSFDGVNLCGSDISRVLYPIGIETANTDEYTISHLIMTKHYHYSAFNRYFYVL